MNRTLIVVLTWNRLKKTKKTIRSLFRYNNRDLDFLFIDNGSTDGTVEWIENHNWNFIKNSTNEGIFRASTKAWTEGVKMGYDFILNLQNDFPCTRKIPFDEMESYMDDNLDVCYIRLNKKKDKKKNIVTDEPIRYWDETKLGEYKVMKCNYHTGFNPSLIRSTIINDYIKYDDKDGVPRERILMNNFEATGKQCAKLYPEVFETLRQDHKVPGWTR